MASQQALKAAGHDVIEDGRRQRQGQHGGRQTKPGGQDDHRHHWQTAKANQTPGDD
jgi:hypothetical protein